MSLPGACFSLAWCILSAVVAFSSILYSIAMIATHLVVIFHSSVNMKQRVGSFGAFVFYFALLIGHFYIGYRGFVLFYSGNYFDSSCISSVHFIPMVFFSLLDYDQKETDKEKEKEKNM